MIVWGLPEFSVFRTYDAYLWCSIFIRHFWVIILIIVHFFCLLYEFCSGESNTTNTFRAIAAMQMEWWRLPKLSMFRANNANLLYSIYIIYFRVVIIYCVTGFGSSDKRLLRNSFITATSRATCSTQMSSCALAELSMFRTYDYDLILISSVVLSS